MSSLLLYSRNFRISTCSSRSNGGPLKMVLELLGGVTTVNNTTNVCLTKGIGNVIPLHAWCGPEGGQRYSPTLPLPEHQKGVSGQQHASAAFHPWEIPGTHFTGGWVGPSAGLGGRKISSTSGFDPGPSSPQSVAIPTELPGPQCMSNNNVLLQIKTTFFSQQWPSPGFIRDYVLKKRVLYNMRYRVSMLRSHHLRVGQSYFLFLLWPRCGLWQSQEWSRGLSGIAWEGW